MSRTFGGVSTDKILTNTTTTGTSLTFAAWTYRTGDGGGSLGRIFDQETTGGGGGNMNLYNDNDGVGSAEYAFVVKFSGLSTLWSISPPTANAWHHICVTYDGSAVANDPIIYLDGVAQTLLSDVNAVAGTLDTSTKAYCIGNRNYGTDRNWAGDICEAAIWERILTADEARALGKGFSPLNFPRSLAMYTDLVQNINDRKNNAALTVSGTVVAVHPRIIYPSNSFGTLLQKFNNVLAWITA
jgi:hypothetical protein